MGGGSVVESVEEAKAGDAPGMGEDVELEAFLLPKDTHSSFLARMRSSLASWVGRAPAQMGPKYSRRLLMWDL